MEITEKIIRCQLEYYLVFDGDLALIPEGHLSSSGNVRSIEK